MPLCLFVHLSHGLPLNYAFLCDVSVIRARAFHDVSESLYVQSDWEYQIWNCYKGEFENILQS